MTVELESGLGRMKSPVVVVHVLPLDHLRHQPMASCGGSDTNFGTTLWKNCEKVKKRRLTLPVATHSCSFCVDNGCHSDPERLHECRIGSRSLRLFVTFQGSTWPRRIEIIRSIYWDRSRNCSHADGFVLTVGRSRHLLIVTVRLGNNLSASLQDDPPVDWMNIWQRPWEGSVFIAHLQKCCTCWPQKKFDVTASFCGRDPLGVDLSRYPSTVCGVALKAVKMPRKLVSWICLMSAICWSADSQGNCLLDILWQRSWWSYPPQKMGHTCSVLWTVILPDGMPLFRLPPLWFRYGAARYEYQYDVQLRLVYFCHLMILLCRVCATWGSLCPKGWRQRCRAVAVITRFTFCCQPQWTKSTSVNCRPPIEHR